jgi:hypothetical protein
LQERFSDTLCGKTHCNKYFRQKEVKKNRDFPCQYLSVQNGCLIYTASSGIWRNWSYTKQISSDKQEVFGYLETPDPRR